MRPHHTRLTHLSKHQRRLAHNHPLEQFSHSLELPLPSAAADTIEWIPEEELRRRMQELNTRMRDDDEEDELVDLMNRLDLADREYDDLGTSRHQHDASTFFVELACDPAPDVQHGLHAGASTIPHRSGQCYLTSHAPDESRVALYLPAPVAH